jgi:hypothetical protein
VPGIALVMLLAAIGMGVTVYLVRYVPTMRVPRR